MPQAAKPREWDRPINLGRSYFSTHVGKPRPQAAAPVSRMGDQFGGDSIRDDVVANRGNGRERVHVCGPRSQVAIAARRVGRLAGEVRQKPRLPRGFGTLFVR
jgi:hypothetical protein